MRPYDFVEPASLEEAVTLLQQHGPDAKAIAGGTAFVLMLKQWLLRPKLVVGLRQLPELGGVRTFSDGGIEIGATTTHREIERSGTVRAYSGALADAFGSIATVRIRNQGTVGGNLAHADPSQDPPCILLALDAVVAVTGSGGDRTVELSALFVDYFETVLEPGEVITSVRLPPRPAGARARYVRFLPRTHDDYPTVAVAVSARPTDGAWCDVRIAVGAAGPVPLRMTAAESGLEGRAFDPRALEDAADMVAEAVDPLDDVRGSRDYKREMARIWTRRALERLATDGAGEDP